MSFFAIPYRVLFHDTMAYGSHHYLTNLKFQNISRETLLFESRAGAENSGWQEQLENIVLLTREAYAKSFAPVGVGERVVIFQTYEEPTLSTVRLCFRVISADGEPVTCGFQTMVAVDARTQRPCPAPRLVTQYLEKENPSSILEPAHDPSFRDRVLQGQGMSEVWSPAIVALARSILAGPQPDSRPRIVDLAGVEYPIHGHGRGPADKTSAASAKPASGDPAVAAARPSAGKVFTFPGQGSYDGRLLRQLFDSEARNAADFRRADEICRDRLGHAFLPLVEEDDDRRRESLLAAYPDLDQIGIYLSQVMLARRATAEEGAPDLVLGHSFGEIAALTVAGVLDFDAGVDVVCSRILALERCAQRGGMAVMHSAEEEARSAVARLGEGIEIAVLNHPRQTVVSGSDHQLRRLPGAGISVTRLPSRYPFHSSLLAGAVAPFEAAMAGLRKRRPELAVFLGTERRFYTPDCDPAEIDLAEILALQLIRTLDFRTNARRILDRGYRTFVHCGPGDTVNKLLRMNLREGEEIETRSALPSRSRSSVGVTGESTVVAAPPSPSPRRTTRSVASPAIKAARPEPRPHDDDARRQAMAPSAASPEEPVAVVALGSFLPGAKDPDTFWRNLKAGVSGIVDLRAVDAGAEHDYLGGSVEDGVEIVPDKTYSLLSGTILEIPYEAALLAAAWSREEFEALTRGQRLLSLAVAQCLTGVGERGRVRCILGATADGSNEMDDALFVAGMCREVDGLDVPQPVRESARELIEKTLGFRRDQSAELTQHRIYRHVIRRLLGEAVEPFIVDTACSSSLYSINLGIKALQRREADLVLAGGVFAPGPANQTLFAQFRGLSATRCRPLDAGADGVIFGDGAAVVALKRLSDARAAGNQVLAVIRGIGMSSDGKSPSINVPREQGQILAMERAYRRAGIDPCTVQYVEAHATATPVGDGVELRALKHVFSGWSPGRPRVAIGSAKALIGHTGWVSGVASVIKLCKALEEKTIAAQHHFESPTAELADEGCPFVVPTENTPWPENAEGLPRRAAVSSFGFGGTNGHLVLEAYDPEYHGAICAGVAARTPPVAHTLVVVGVGGFFPAPDDLAADAPTRVRRFDRGRLKLPAKKLVLPDVAECMDASQYLMALAAERVIDGLPKSWQKLRDETAVIVGLESKTDFGATVLERIFIDRLCRGIDALPNAEPEARQAVFEVAQRIRATVRPSGPYTLPGLMPNIAASRVSSLFDLHGPNIVVDMGDRSLIKALEVADELLRSGDCRLALAGAVAAAAGGEGQAEAALLVGLTTLATAREEELPVLATLELAPAPGRSGIAEAAIGQTDDIAPGYSGAAGAPRLLAALRAASNGGGPSVLRVATESGIHLKVGVAPGSVPPALGPPVSDGHASAYDYVRGTPIRYFTPRIVPATAPVAAKAPAAGRVLFLCDSAEAWVELAATPEVAGFDHLVLCRGSSGLERGVPWQQPSGDVDEAQVALALAGVVFDSIVAVARLPSADDSDGVEQLLAPGRPIVDLLFACCKAAYPGLQAGKIAVTVLLLESPGQARLHPASGLLSGFMKSLARELPAAACSVVHSDADDIAVALRQATTERGTLLSTGEVCYRGGRRHVVALASMTALHRGGKPALDADSVVLSTAGAKGVTAVLTEEILDRFGCTVIAVGRTELAGAPADILAMSETELREYESTFYRQEMERDPSQKIPQLRRRYQSLLGAWELATTVARLRAKPGRFEYRCVDITDARRLDDLIASIYEERGRIDLVVHGAGIQRSCALTKKPLIEFNRIIDTKVVGLANLHRSIEARRCGHPVRYHVLTSAFSTLGNDGQPDYGAANQALDRLAAWMHAPAEDRHWSTLAWLGWAGIGMTRGSEFAALAANRRLRGVTAEEGRALFADLLAGDEASPINVLLAEGELAFYQPPLVAEPVTAPGGVAPLAAPMEDVFEVPLSVVRAPFLKDHLVNGVPTLPAAHLFSLAAQAARRLRPGLMVRAFTDATFDRFIKLPRTGDLELRLVTRVVSEADGKAVVRVSAQTDFVHASGKVLRKGILHGELSVHLAAELPTSPRVELNGPPAGWVQLPDPYVDAASPVHLNGGFDALAEILVGSSVRRASYRLDPKVVNGGSDILANLVMVDALWRFSAITRDAAGSLPIFVPAKCRSMEVYFDYTSSDVDSLRQPLTFYGENPYPENDLLHVGPIQVVDSEGRVLLHVDGAYCRPFGAV